MKSWKLGSPPHRRGKGHPDHAGPEDMGITPAWAGKRYINVSKDRVSEDHPREGGEKAGVSDHGRDGTRNARLRFTPARAGKRHRYHGTGVWPPDHPRVGGEKWIPSPFRPLAQGSPPRGRGKATTSSASPTRLGITPAWAGKSRPLAGLPPSFQDHPRVGGEKCKHRNMTPDHKGSPPRGRGKVRLCPRRTAYAGITPAWAGKSSYGEKRKPGD